MSRINTNVASLNAQRNISQTNQAFGRTVGRLSSGFRINRAADDAAGLGIANRLRSDIRALNQASRNATQANSLLQVAEGATNQVSGIVDRMKELAAQAASDNVNNSDRALIQAEFAQLQAEITRIVDTTKFQGVSLLGGTELNNTSVDALETAVNGVANAGITISGSPAATGDFAITAAFTAETNPGDGDGTLVISVDGNPVQTVSGLGAALSDADGFSFSVNGLSFSVSIDAGETVAGADLATALTQSLSFDADDLAGNLQFLVSVSGNATGPGGGAGADFVSMSVQDLTLATLGLDASSLATRDDAVAALGTLDSAIASISSAFGEIGAAQNRLDFAQANVATAIENFSAAESVIRDADFAAEASEFARLQILQQSQIAMLAQANAAPQGVLQLLS